MCRKVPKRIGYFCSKSCSVEAQKKAPVILEVLDGHDAYNSAVNQFNASWRRAGKNCPPVRHVYIVVSTQASLKKYEAHRDKVEALRNFQARGQSAGNEKRRWHGTRRYCNLGDKGNTQLCTSTSCSLCRVVRQSYNLSHLGKRTGWGKFGAGIYTSSLSSKSDELSENIGHSNLKALVLNKVIVGEGCKVTQDNTTLKAPPKGYDSVLSEKAGRLHDDEVVVYSNDAIRPCYLVMYDA